MTQPAGPVPPRAIRDLGRAAGGALIFSLLLMHGFVFSMGFAGGSEVSADEPWWSGFIRMTLPGFVLALAVSFGLLWLFAQTDGLSFGSAVMAAIVLVFPCSIGAAAARLIL